MESTYTYPTISTGNQRAAEECASFNTPAHQKTGDAGLDVRAWLHKKYCWGGDAISASNVADADAFIKRQKAVYNALMLALDTDGYLLNVMSRDHYAVVETHYHTHTPREYIRARGREASVKSVSHATTEKRRELKQFLQSIDDPAFTTALQVAMASGMGPEIRYSPFTPLDAEGCIGTLAAAGRNSPRPVAAILEQAEKQKIEYEALASSNNPDGIATRILASAMKNLLPAISPQEVHQAAKDYMCYYYTDALIRSEAFEAEGEIVAQAIKRAHQLRRKSPPYLALIASCEYDAFLI
ncbi:MAG: hypothetical protein SFX19_00940 [Alphaproteobacteria bacterium]|nr:hypothetical protein [Alphaproteobacteria bacterium]